MRMLKSTQKTNQDVAGSVFCKIIQERWHFTEFMLENNKNLYSYSPKHL